VVGWLRLREHQGMSNNERQYLYLYRTDLQSEDDNVALVSSDVFSLVCKLNDGINSNIV
jgi:hypothetical protein